MSNVTFWPSARPARPARSTALICTNTSLLPSFGWINPKPFWPLNHFTVPVAILFSKAHMRVSRGYHASRFNFVDVFGKGARGPIQQGTAADRTTRTLYPFACFASGATGLIAGFAGLSVIFPEFQNPNERARVDM